MIYLKPNEFFVSSEIPIATELRSPQEPYPEHSHAFEELMLVSGGSGTHVINDIPMNLSKNYVCFIKREDRHLFENVEGLHLSNVLFDQSKMAVDSSIAKYIPDTDQQSRGWFINDQSSETANRLITRLDSEIGTDTFESKIVCQSLFNLLLVELSRGRIYSLEGESDEDKVLSVMGYLHQNYAEQFNLQDLAEQAGISTKQLSKILSRMTGMSYPNYLNHIRMSKALEALKYSDRSITDIAFDVGYQDSNYFSSKFKKVFNATPREVRLGTEIRNQNV
ncbi:helix-turn-helix domain-containing protein [Vibrio parahaemolyticus]|uniref:helix-turn-helix domain-containing protein n=1 Tax=Vibrio parahaemolyticus TaxID=670 RepID=UPI0031FE79D2